MQKIKSIIGIVACLLLICMFLVVGILAASTASVQVSVSVNYTPSVSANLKVATSDSESGCYWDGTNSFPTNEASSDGKEGYVSIVNDETRIPTKEESYLNCDVFGRVTIYIQIENTSGFAVCSDITLTLKNDDSTSNSTSIKIQSVENVYLEAKPEGESTEEKANIKVAKVVLSFVNKTTPPTTTTGVAEATLNVDIIRCDGVEGESSSYLPELLYSVDFSKDESTFKNVISKSATNINLNAYTIAKINSTNEDPKDLPKDLNVYTITSTVSPFYLKITNTSESTESTISYKLDKLGSGTFTGATGTIDAGTSSVIKIDTSTEIILTLSDSNA